MTDRDDVGATPPVRLMVLDILPGPFAICRFPPDAAIPPSAMTGTFFSLTRTPAELSMVCDSASVPDGVTSVGPWTALAVRGPLDFALTGVLASLTAALARAGVSLFAVSTYDTDYLLVRSHDLERAAQSLRAAGHQVVEA